MNLLSRDKFIGNGIREVAEDMSVRLPSIWLGLRFQLSNSSLNLDQPAKWALAPDQYWDPHPAEADFFRSGLILAQRNHWA